MGDLIENLNALGFKDKISDVGFTIHIHEGKVILDVIFDFNKNLLHKNFNGFSFSGSLNVSEQEGISAVFEELSEKFSMLNQMGVLNNEVEQPTENKQEAKPKPSSESEVAVEKEPVKEPDKKKSSFEMPPMPGYSENVKDAPENRTVEKSKAQPDVPKPPDNKPNSGQVGSEEYNKNGIKDVQMLAINTQLEINNANYKELVKEAFEAAGIKVDEIPSIEKLTYQQAIEVIKYGNQKFKK